jgi:hypothetical protein
MTEKKGERTTKVFAKAGQTEAVFQLFVFQFSFLYSRAL